MRPEPGRVQELLAGSKLPQLPQGQVGDRELLGQPKI